MIGKRITVITISLNTERYLEQTITSVINQSYRDAEYIIIDGGSTDGTLDIIKKHESKISCWISEPDRGIADAMNKGLSLATGDYILFLHSDDYLLESNVLERVASNINGNFDIYIYQVIFDDHDNKRISRNKSLGWRTNFKMGSCHQGQLCSKKLFKKIGLFDISFKINMDYDFLLRAYRNKATSLAVNVPIAVMRLIGISSRRDWPGLKERFIEERSIHIKNCPNRRMQIIYMIYWSLYLPYRKFCNLCKSLF